MMSLLSHEAEGQAKPAWRGRGMQLKAYGAAFGWLRTQHDKRKSCQPITKFPFSLVSPYLDDDFWTLYVSFRKWERPIPWPTLDSHHGSSPFTTPTKDTVTR